jgi:NAD(P)-dependent dehydrogenase (short-subunit alcohol dehydrogenase family)
LATQLAARGAKVVLVARGKERLDDVVRKIREQGGDAHGYAADVSHRDASHAIAGAAAALVGPIDLLVHNASTLGPVPLRLLLDTDCENLAEVLETNLVGPFRLSKIIVGSMLLRGRGLVVHVSSDAAVAAYRTWGAYSVSKAAQDHLSRVWAAELAETPVRFVSVDPGEMRTKMHADAMPDADPEVLASPADVARRLVEKVILEAGVPSGARLELGSLS